MTIFLQDVVSCNSSETGRISSARNAQLSAQWLHNDGDIKLCT